MKGDEWSFLIPFDGSDMFRFRTSLDQIMSMGGKINMGYEEGHFSVPIPIMNGEVKGSYSIENGWLRITIDEAPPGMNLEDVKKLYLEHLGLDERDLDLN